MAIRRFLQANSPSFAILRILNRGNDEFLLAIASAKAVIVCAGEVISNFGGSFRPIKILEDRSGPLKFCRFGLAKNGGGWKNDLKVKCAVSLLFSLALSLAEIVMLPMNP